MMTSKLITVKDLNGKARESVLSILTDLDGNKTIYVRPRAFQKIGFLRRVLRFFFPRKPDEFQVCVDDSELDFIINALSEGRQKHV